MPKSIPSVLRASETVTIRLTKQHKALLERVASTLGMTTTGVLREHICQKAKQLGLDVDDMRVTSDPSLPTAGIIEAMPADAEEPVVSRGAVFGDLATRYRATFADRGEGTRRELDEALRFLMAPHDDGGGAFVPKDLPLTEVSSEMLTALRERVLVAPLRLSRKNLYLTYFRMMLHFAFKRGEIVVDVTPGAELRSIKATEMAEPWAPAAGDDNTRG